MLARNRRFVVHIQSGAIIPLRGRLVLELRAVGADLLPVVLEEAEVGGVARLGRAVVFAVGTGVVVAVGVGGAEVAGGFLDADGEVRHVGAEGEEGRFAARDVLRGWTGVACVSGEDSGGGEGGGRKDEGGGEG